MCSPRSLFHIPEDLHLDPEYNPYLQRKRVFEAHKKSRVEQPRPKNGSHGGTSRRQEHHDDREWIRTSVNKKQQRKWDKRKKIFEKDERSYQSDASEMVRRKSSSLVIEIRFQESNFYLWKFSSCSSVNDVVVELLERVVFCEYHYYWYELVWTVRKLFFGWWPFFRMSFQNFCASPPVVFFVLIIQKKICLFVMRSCYWD